MALGTLYRPVRRQFHRALSAARGGRGVRVRGAPDWKIAVAADGYEDLRYWLHYESATFALLRRIWLPGMSVLDVGAHHGLFSLCCCRPGALPSRVVAVEPSPAALPLLQSNRAAHPGLDWTIVAAAAGESEGTLPMHTGYIHMLVAAPGLHHGEEVTGETVEVRLTTLDTVCEEQKLRPDLVKIDVEGYEAEALRGARETLRRGPMIVLEWHVAMIRQRGQDPIAALQPLAEAGYRFEPYEFPGGAALEAAELAALPEQEIHRFLCRAGNSPAAN